MCFVCVSVEAFLKMKNHNVVLEMITSFSVFQQPLQHIIHSPVQGEMYAKLGLVSKFASSYFLFFPAPNYLILPDTQH